MILGSYQQVELEETTEQNTDFDSPDLVMKYIWGCFSITLCTFNVKTSKEEKINLELPVLQKLDQFGAKCLLPDGSLFYHNSHIAIIIDPTYRIKPLPSYSPRSLNACAIYKDKEIYLFGGSSNNSAKFSMTKNKWTTLTKIPISLWDYPFSAIFKNYILLGSMSSNQILYYDTTIDSYNQILTLSSLTSKAIFVDNETVYIIEFSKCIYRSTDHLVTWDNIGSSEILAADAPIISNPITYNQKVYFVNYFGIYTFDLRQKNVEKIKAIILEKNCL